MRADELVMRLNVLVVVNVVAACVDINCVVDDVALVGVVAGCARAN